MRRFAKNDIISLVGETPRYDLAESVGPDLRLGELMEEGPLDLALSYGTAPGDARLRERIAALHGVAPDDVVITVGGMHALFLLAFILCRPGDEAVTTAPLFPLARNVLDSVGATVRVLRLSFDDGYQPDVKRSRASSRPAPSSSASRRRRTRQASRSRRRPCTRSST